MIACNTKSEIEEDKCVWAALYEMCLKKKILLEYRPTGTPSAMPDLTNSTKLMNEQFSNTKYAPCTTQKDLNMLIFHLQIHQRAISSKT